MRRATLVLSRFLLSLVVFALALGCGGPKRPTVEVSGTIKFKDGKALPAGTTVVLNPAEGGVGTASGKTGTDGSFTLRHSSGSGGVEVGKYTIKLIAPEGDTEFYKMVPKDVVNGDVLFAEIKDGMAPLELTVPRATGKKGE
jgi:hypothetical protein